MNKKVLQKLEYPQITERLAALASSHSGRALCRALIPYTSITEITRAQEETSAAFSRIVRKGRPSFSGFTDVRGYMKRLQMGASLSSGELLKIAALVECASAAKAYGTPLRAEDDPDCLTEAFSGIHSLSPLGKEIRRCIPNEDEFSDDASPALKNIRRSMGRLDDKMHATLNALVNGSLRSCLQDALITMRGDRYCLPVKAEYRHQVKGMIHDQSSTGATLFIEPMSVVNLNNELKGLYAREKEEIQAILSRLSDSVAQNDELLLENYRLLTSLDFIFARGALALEMNASPPVFNDRKVIRLREARHPLLDPKTVVPISFSLGDSFRMLIVTGPNTGGKTVSLKTLGLLTLMGQAGLHIPALHRSELTVFQEIYADIGDEQSIEQSLSTFSSHMTNIVTFLKKANENSLMLFDELGAGTDPTEGAALALAILENLHSRNILTMATTHYSELKMYALSSPGVENACCEFDVTTLRPTYRLMVGIPGKSNAFAIAAKLGLPEKIIDSARDTLSVRDKSFEDLFTRLEQDRKTLEKDREEVLLLKSRYLGQQEDLEKKIHAFENKKNQILTEAKEEAFLILTVAKETADETIRNIRKYGGDTPSLSGLEKERERLRAHIKETLPDCAPPQAPPKPSPLKALKSGESVKVLSMNINGIILSPPDSKGMVQVQMGILKSMIPASDLAVIPEDPFGGKKAKSSPGAGKKGLPGKSLTIRPEINLLGKTVDEAIAELDKYLDDARIANLHTVRVVHGKGTGALRQGIHTYLGRQRAIKSFRLGSFGEGDAGVTIVEL